MNFIFKSKHRTPADLVRQIREANARLESSSTSSEAKRKVSFAAAREKERPLFSTTSFTTLVCAMCRQAKMFRNVSIR